MGRFGRYTGYERRIWRQSDCRLLGWHWRRLDGKGSVANENGTRTELPVEGTRQGGRHAGLSCISRVAFSICP